MDKKAENFVNEFVIGLGFLSGLWIAVGIDPQAEIFKAFDTILKTYPLHIDWEWTEDILYVSVIPR